MEIRHIRAGRDRAASFRVNGQIVYVIDLERIAGRNADHGGNTLPLVDESISAISVKGRMQRKRSDVILRADFGRRGNGNLGVSSDAYRHETKSGNTAPIPNFHGNHLPLYSNAPGTKHKGQNEAICRGRLRHTADLPRRRGHEFRPDWIADAFAKNNIDCGAVAFRQGPPANLVDGRKLLRMTGAPERDANTGLVEEPADRQMNHALAKVFAGERIQLACCIEVFGEMRRLKLWVRGLAHVAVGKLAIGTHRTA